MYIQITTRCNMSCEHCCYSCGPKGDDMSMEVYKAALQVCEDYGHIPFLGGGEPTVHPEFYTMMALAIACQTDEDIGPGIITNGKRTKHALFIAKLAAKEVITAELSRDQYHDPIDQHVVNTFESLGSSGGWNYGVRDTSHGGTSDPMPQGRALKVLGLDPEEDEEEINEIRTNGEWGVKCVCKDLMVKPDGRILQCGCDDAPEVGNVFDGYDTPLRNECFRDASFVRDCLDNEEYKHLIYA